jgi:hypothetical protein
MEKSAEATKLARISRGLVNDFESELNQSRILRGVYATEARRSEEIIRQVKTCVIERIK